MIDFTKDSEYIRMYGKKGREMLNFKGVNIMLDKVMSIADASINVGIKLIYHFSLFCIDWKFTTSCQYSDYKL